MSKRLLLSLLLILALALVACGGDDATEEPEETTAEETTTEEEMADEEEMAEEEMAAVDELTIFWEEVDLQAHMGSSLCVHAERRPPGLHVRAEPQRMNPSVVELIILESIDRCREVRLILGLWGHRCRRFEPRLRRTGSLGLAVLPLIEVNGEAPPFANVLGMG